MTAWLGPLVVAIAIFAVHYMVARRSPLFASPAAGDEESMPVPRAAYPAYAATEVVAVALLVAAMHAVAAPPLVRYGAGTLVLALGLLAPLGSRRPGVDRLHHWMQRLARMWPGGVDPEGELNVEPVAFAADADPFDERVLVERVIRLGETDIDEVMVPRGEVIAIDHEAAVRALFEVVEEHRHSRYPIIEGDLDHVVGVVNVFDVQKLCPDEPVSSFTRSVSMVPEAKSAVELLDEMSRGDRKFAVIVDEFGGTSGVVTMEDLVEQLVGEIWDEHERAEVRMRRVGKDVYVCEASIPLKEVEMRLGVRFPEGDYETLAGYLLEEFSRIPVRGDAVSYEDMVLEVLTADRRRIESVQIDLRARKE